MEHTIVTICGLVTLFGLAITLKCVQVQLFKNSRDAFWGNTKNTLRAVVGSQGLFQYILAVVA